LYYTQVIFTNRNNKGKKQMTNLQAYELAVENFRTASATFLVVRTKFHALQCTIEEYMTARKAYEAVEADLDAAEYELQNPSSLQAHAVFETAQAIGFNF